MDLTTYFEKFKAVKKVVVELNHTHHGHTVVEILCKEQNVKPEEFGPDEAIKCFGAKKERILGLQLIMNVDRDKYGTLIKDYNREYLGGINKYTKTLMGHVQPAEGMGQAQEDRAKLSVQGWSVIQHGRRRGWGSSRQRWSKTSKMQ